MAADIQYLADGLTLPSKPDTKVNLVKISSDHALVVEKTKARGQRRRTVELKTPFIWITPMVMKMIVPAPNMSTLIGNGKLRWMFLNVILHVSKHKRSEYEKNHDTDRHFVAVFSHMREQERGDHFEKRDFNL